MQSRTGEAESRPSGPSSRAIGRWPGAWLRGELGLWRSITRRRPVVWTLLGAGLVALLTPVLWLAHARYLAHLDRLHRAVYAGDIDEVRRLLAAGADVNYSSPSGRNVGFGPDFYWYWYALRGIMSHKSPPWEKGDTPLQIALRSDGYRQTPEMVDVLLAAGARFEVDHSNSNDLYYTATILGHTRTVMRLLDVGCDPNAQLWNGRRPLHNVVLVDDEESVRLLLERGAAVNSTDARGATPLIVAARALLRPDSATISMLLDAGADPASRDEAGRTPLHWATECGRPAAIRQLLDAGADRDSCDNHGRTPHQIALSRPDLEIRALFETDSQAGRTP